VLRIEKCVQFFGAGDPGMSAKAGNEISEAALAEVLTATGISVGPEEIGAVAGLLARIRQAAVSLGSPSFDDTSERFYRLLEDDGSGADA
jgi:hypothetical protein